MPRARAGPFAVSPVLSTRVPTTWFRSGRRPREGLAPEPDWIRAYHEIVDFEESLVRFGIVVVKFWLAISPDEQLARFRSRAKTPFKRFKLTSEDWRNRKKWALYERAVCDMVDRTSTDIAPWHLVEANDKKWARVKVLETVCQTLKDAMK